VLTDVSDYLRLTLEREEGPPLRAGAYVGRAAGESPPPYRRMLG